MIQPAARWRRALAFVATAFVASLVFNYAYAQVRPMADAMLPAAVLLMGLSWVFGLWKVPFGWTGRAVSVVVSLTMPFVAMVSLIILLGLGP